MEVTRPDRFWPLVPFLLSAALLAELSRTPPHHFILFAALAAVFQFLPGRRAAAIGSLLLAAGFLWFSSVSELGRVSWVTPHPAGSYNLFADQLRAGKISMPQVPDPRLLALADPYAPAARSGIPVVWDHSYYDGRYYLYWGIGPVLTLILPFRLLTGLYLTEFAQGFVFAVLAILFGYLVTARLYRLRAGRDPDGMTTLLMVAVLTLCGEYPESMRRILIYQVPTFACTAFLFAGFYVVLLRERLRFALPLAGALLSLAVASRPTSMMAIAAVPFLFPAKGRWKALTPIAWTLVPGALLIALYNHARFDSPFEFGVHYQLNHLPMRDWHAQLPNLAYGFFAFLTQPLAARPDFPYYDLRIFGDPWLILRHTYMSESVVGLLPFCPFVLLAAWRLRRTHGDGRNTALYGLILAGFLVLLANSIGGVCRHYSNEFFPLFLSACLVAALAGDPGRSSWLRRPLAWLLILLSLNQAIFASYVIYRNPGFLPNAAALERISRFYRPISQWSRN